MPLVPRRKWIRKHPNAEHPGQAYRRYKRRYREGQALQDWSPVQKGPLPPLIERMFMRESQQQANQWAAPRQRAINRYTGALAQQLAPIAERVGGFYGQAQQGQAGSDAALAQMLSGQGQQIAGDLQAQLAAAGQATGGLQAGQVGQGSAAAAYALGAANLGRLIAQGAASQTAAAQLPGIARLGGLEHTRELQGQAQAQAQQNFQDMMNRELEKWISRTGLGQQRRELGENRRQFNRGLGEERRQFNLSLAEERARYQQELGEATREERQELKEERRDTWQETRPEARQMARRMKRNGIDYNSADDRLTRFIRNQMEGMLSEERARRIVRRMLAQAGFRRPIGGGNPEGEPGSKVPGKGGGGGGGPGSGL